VPLVVAAAACPARFDAARIDRPALRVRSAAPVSSMAQVFFLHGSAQTRRASSEAPMIRPVPAHAT
jgi:hypothetical protein